MTTLDPKHFDPVAEPTGDKVHRIVRAAIGALPVLSGTALEALNALIEDPYQKRRTEWLHALTQAINESSVELARLKEDAYRADLLLSAILQSTDIASKTNDQAIHHRLIQIVLNAAGARPVEADLLAIYLSTVRQMTSSHFALLEIISSRKRYERGPDLKENEDAFFAEIAACPEIAADVPSERLLRDLESMQLIFSPSGSPASLGGATNYCTKTLSQFGSKFLAYVAVAKK
jgi:hypothetical protein